MTNSISSSAQRANTSKAVEYAGRAGFVVNGVLHLLIAWIGLQLALQSYSGAADQSGALQLLAGNSFGSVALWLGVVGFAGLCLWALTEAIVGATEPKDRMVLVAKAVVYAVLSLACLTYARGQSARSGRSQSVDVTASLMQQPFGRLLVGLVGAGVVAVGGYHVVKGWQRKFLEDLEQHPGRGVQAAGRVGYVGKGVALGVVGLLFVLAALRGQAKQATGLDGALRTLLDLPLGRIIVALVALGFAAYGCYSFARAKYARF
ncbi:MAG TPA: DUF1206 domain-containing protein [Dermatophilaceae bacterium]|nr:DUF1206 domain-containing protein [Dermatophilaceae bacterium]